MNARHATVLSITVCTFCGDLPLLLFLRATSIRVQVKRKRAYDGQFFSTSTK